MKILITGGTGFIGSRLAFRLLDRGETVAILGQINTSAEVENQQLLEAKGANIIIASLMETERIAEALVGVDLVFHLAAAQHEANVPDQRFWDVNVTGTSNMLEASVVAGVKRFIHGSTIGVYGSALEGTLDENSPLQPDNIYGVTKLKGEKTVLAFKEKLPVCIIRISETYGPGDRRLLKLFQAIQKKMFFMIGNGKNLHHLIYIEDLIDGLLIAASLDAALGRVFVLGGKEVLSTDQMVSTIAKILGVNVLPIRIPFYPIYLVAWGLESLLKPLGIQPPLHRRRMDFFKKSFIFAQDETRRTLDFSPKFSFQDGVRDTANWYRQMGCL